MDAIGGFDAEKKLLPWFSRCRVRTPVIHEFLTALTIAQ